MSQKKTEKAIDSLPPHSDEAEAGVLSCCIQDPDNQLPLCFIKFNGAEVFFNNRNQVIFFALSELFNDGVPIDDITLRNKLNDDGTLGDCGGAEYLQTLRDVSPSVAHLPAYLDIVHEKWKHRQAKKGAVELNQDLNDLNGQSIGEVIAAGELRLQELSRSVDAGVIKEMQSLTKGASGRFEEMVKNEGRLLGIPTGLVDFDKRTSGLQPKMYVIAARPGCGKTSIAMTMADHIAVTCKVPVGIVDLEIDAETLTDQLICSRALVNFMELADGKVCERDFPKIIHSLGQIHAAPICICDDSDMSISTLRIKARQMVRLYGIKVLIVDYLQLISSSGKKINSRQEEISHIARSLKNMSKQLSIPIVVLAQLNRSIEKRTGNAARPTMSDLRESGEIEAAADFIGILYSKEESPNGQLDVPITMAIVKHRGGSTEDINFLFKKGYTRFCSTSKVD